MSGVVAQILERMPFASVVDIKTHLIETAAAGVVADTQVLGCGGVGGGCVDVECGLGDGVGRGGQGFSRGGVE